MMIYSLRKVSFGTLTELRVCLTQLTQFGTVSFVTLFAANTYAAQATTTPTLSASPKVNQFQFTVPNPTATSIATLDGMPPIQTPAVVTSRFGKNREDKPGGRPHSGFDMDTTASDKRLFAIAAGIVIENRVMNGGGNIIRIRKNNGDIYQYLHMRFPSPLKVGDPVTAGQVVGIMGTTTGTARRVAEHLHFTYSLGKNDPSRLNNIWLGKNSNPLHNTKRVGAKDGLSFVVDPTPYLRDDYKIQNDQLTPWLGSTVRQQYNILYGANLPVGAGATQPTYTVPKFVTPSNYPVSDKQVAAARAQIVQERAKALAEGRITAAEANGGVVSQQEIANEFSDTAIFGTSDDVPIDIGVNSMSPEQLVMSIGSSRYGNPGWDKQLLNLSMKGMWTEFLSMTNASNYMQRQLALQRQRIEGLLATYSSAKLKRTTGEIPAIYAEAQKGTIIPRISSVPLEALPSDTAESIVYNTQTVTRNGSGSGVSAAKLATIEQVAKRLNINPNDLAAIISFETVGSFSPSIQNPISTATGLIQFMMGSGGTPGRYYGHTREQFRTLTFDQQMEYVYKYFNNLGVGRSGSTSLATLYSLVMGVPRGGYTISRYPKVFEKNPLWDVNKDGLITGQEAVNGSQFRAHVKKYFANYP